MKKFAAFILTVAAAIACAFCAAGCKKSDELKLFVPDGAPALSVAGIERTEAGKYFDVTVVNAETIGGYVSGKMEADAAVMPVNAAVKVLGSGDNYTLLGTVTHGNLYIMKKQGGEDISSAADLSKLVGKTVGVINLDNVPGLTLKVILNDNNLEFNELKDGTVVSADKVNLKNVTAPNATPANTDCDYFVVPEPAASTKQNGTGGKLSIAGSLQTLYGGEGGYPQAVVVVRNSVIEDNPDIASALIESFASTKSWLEDEGTSAQDIVGAIDGMRYGDFSPSFTADNLTKEVIAHCGINFVGNGTGKAEIISFMAKLNAVSGNNWGTPADKFFFAA